MKLSSGYKDIFRFSLPIMLGSAVQNVIALTDSIFLYHLDQTDFAAIGFVSVYYLIVAGIGYGFSKGGQILIARRMGQERYERVGSTFYSLVFFELCMAVLMWAMLYFLSPFIFSSLIDSVEIYEKSLEYIRPRSWGVFFSYVGVSFVALYTGIARTWFIVVDTLILAVVNIVLNYGLIYGNFGLPSLGIAGAGWASSISEVVAFAIFAIYMIKDPALRKFKMGKGMSFDTGQMRAMFSIGSPIVVQTIVGMGSWFVFFGLIENLGERALAITNLARIIYLILSIPCWGFSSGINTLVSNAVGAKDYPEVWKVTMKTVGVTVFSTLCIGLPVLIFPSIFLYPLLGSDDMSLIIEAQPVFYVLLSILAMFSTGIILLNALTGTGRSMLALKLQFYATAAYMIYVYWVIKQTSLGLVWAWGSELLYWIIIIASSAYFLYRDKWRRNHREETIEV